MGVPGTRYCQMGVRSQLIMGVHDKKKFENHCYRVYINTMYCLNQECQTHFGLGATLVQR